MSQVFDLTARTLGALALLTALGANAVHAASAAAEPRPATAAAVKASASSLTAPTDLVATESLQNGEGPIEGVVCVAGLKYTKEKWRENGRFRHGLTVLSTTAAHLQIQGVRQKFDDVLRARAVPDSKLVDPLNCQEVAFDLIRNMGPLRLPPFDAASWFVGDFGQDECGDTTVLVLARRATSYFFLTVPITKLDPPGLTCLRPMEIKRGWCERRTSCIRNYLATAANQDALVKELAALTRDFAFSR